MAGGSDNEDDPIAQNLMDFVTAKMGEVTAAAEQRERVLEAQVLELQGKLAQLDESEGVPQELIDSMGVLPEKGSEAEKAGVQPGDRLVRVQDNDGKLPMNAPGREVPVTKADYQESPAGRGCGMAAAQRPAGLRRAVHHGSLTRRPFSRTQATLEMVRQMKHCKLSFVSKNDAFG